MQQLKLKKSKLNWKKLALQLLLNNRVSQFESDKRLIETDKLIWFPAKNPAKKSLAGFLFYIDLLPMLLRM
ncbi:hypothetical protein BZG42_04840 [Streptococcus sp. DAT741]|nr:hypothetical protein BZG42_04840 [Streptococcus sp. DAT741]